YAHFPRGGTEAFATEAQREIATEAPKHREEIICSETLRLCRSCCWSWSAARSRRACSTRGYTHFRTRRHRGVRHGGTERNSHRGTEAQRRNYLLGDSAPLSIVLLELVGGAMAACTF